VDTGSKPDFEDRPWLDPDQQPFIRIQGITKSFGPFVAVDNVDLDIYKGELFALLGGSGCGKTTLLRMMAGFETPTSGKISIDGMDMTDVPPYERPVNMMFQSYALFPHMTVEKNVAYGLKRDGLPKAEIADRVSDMLSMVELSAFSKRKPHQLSGGQRQRVALARSLVKNPKLLLLDEPLAALDKRLREQTQYELMSLQEKLGVTFVVVTHDQEEAMTLSTRIAVMDQGYFVQIGTPTEIYEYPETCFVAQPFQVEHPANIPVGAKVWVAIRPEKLLLSPTPITETGLNILKGIVDDIGYYGNSSTYRIRLQDDRIIQVTHPNQRRPRDARHVADWEDMVYLGWEPASGVLLTK